MVARGGSLCRRRRVLSSVVDLARVREKPIAQIAKDLGIAESDRRRWMLQADIDEGKRGEGLGSDERAELVALRREPCRRWR